MVKHRQFVVGKGEVMNHRLKLFYHVIGQLIAILVAAIIVLLLLWGVLTLFGAVLSVMKEVLR